MPILVPWDSQNKAHSVLLYTGARRNLVFLFQSSIPAPESANLFFVCLFLYQFSRDLSFFLGLHSGSKALSGHTFLIPL